MGNRHPSTHAPPQNIEAEESVLGAMLVSEPALTRVIDEVKLNAADFYLDRHRVIFECVYELYAASKPVDQLSVAEALTQRNKIEEAGGKHYVSELAAKVPAAGNAKHYAEIVQENSLLRRLLGAGQQIQGWVNERAGEPRELAARAADLLGTVSPGTAGAGRELAATPYSAVRPEAARWLWAGRIPLGALTIVAGRQGLGKSTLLARLAAGVSRGALAGDLQGQPRTVFTASYEDARGQVAARLLAAGGDMDRVIEIGAREAGEDDLLTLPADLDLLRPAIERERPAALFIDPLLAALPGRVDSHRDQDVRRSLAPLSQLAAEFEIAVVAVLHLRKGAAPEALDRISGSVAFTAAARSVLAFGSVEPDPDEGEVDADRRVLAHAKCNLGSIAPSLAYSIEPVSIEHDGVPIQTSRLREAGEIDVQAGELLSPAPTEDRAEVDLAAEWLADYLADGDWHRTSEVREAAKAADIAQRTLQRAAQRLRVESRRFAPEGASGRGSALGHWRVIVAPRDLARHSRHSDGATMNPLAQAESADSLPLSRQSARPGATTLVAEAEQLAARHPDLAGGGAS